MEIIVHDDGAVAGAVVQARHDGVVLTKVGGQINEHDVVELLGELRANLGRVVFGATVVDEHQFQCVAPLKTLYQAVAQIADGVRAVVDGDHHAHALDGVDHVSSLSRKCRHSRADRAHVVGGVPHRNGQAQLGGVKFFGDGPVARQDALHGLLTMGGNRVVNFGFDALLQQPAAQAVALGVTNPEDVEHIVFVVSQTRLVQALGQVLKVQLGQLAFVLGHGRQVAQLDAQKGGLHFVQTRIHAYIGVDVFLFGAVVAGVAQAIGQCIVVGDNGAGIAQSPQIFGGVKAEAARVAKGARVLTGQLRAV